MKKPVKKVQKKSTNPQVDLHPTLTNHSMNEKFHNLFARKIILEAMIRLDEEHGAGFWGTDKLAKTFIKDTPGQKADKNYKSVMGKEKKNDKSDS